MFSWCGLVLCQELGAVPNHSEYFTTCGGRRTRISIQHWRQRGLFLFRVLFSGSSPWTRVLLWESPGSTTFAKIRIYNLDSVELSQKYQYTFYSNVTVGHKILMEESETKLCLRLNSISLLSQVFYSYTIGQFKIFLHISCLFTLPANLNTEMQR